MNMVKSTLAMTMWIVALFVPSIFNGCSSDNNPASPQSGDWNVTVSVYGYDEYNRAATLPGTTDVTLAAKDRTLHTTIPKGSSSHTFTNLPYQTYVATVHQSGYFSASGGFGSNTYGRLSGGVNLYPIPSSKVRIDSIQYTINSITPQVHLRLYTAQSLPPGGSMYAVLFGGLRSDVSPRYGNYVYSLGWIPQNVGSSLIDTDELYRNLHQGGVPSGTRVYITARLTSGATIKNVDETTGLVSWINLEENTRAVVTFIMP